MGKSFKAAVLAALAASAMLTGQARASTLVIDQEQTKAYDVIQDAELGPIAQTFTPSADNVAGLGVFVEPDNGKDAPTSQTILTLSLWTGAPYDPTSELLAYGSVTGRFEDIAQGGYYQGSGWVDIYFNPVAVTPGQTYYLYATGNNPRMSFMGAKGDVYADGEPYYFGLTPSGTEGYGVSDFAFREYAALQSAAPEPQTWILLIGGLGLAGAALRTRRGATGAVRLA